MTSSQVNVTETPPMSQQDLETLAKNETDENGLILGKFKSVEDLAASYKELEGKLGQSPQEDKPKAEESTTEETKTEAAEFNPIEAYGENIAGILEEAGIDALDLNNRFQESGKLNEDDYSKLEAKGLPKHLVDTYIKGLQGSNADTTEIATTQIQSIKDSIGGDETYSKMVSWAVENLPANEVKEFNSLTETANATAIKLAVQGLYSQYNNAMGVEPNLVSGRASQSGPTPYRSTAEVVTAMSDPRYGKDVTYTEDVQRRLGGSDVFNTGR